MRLISVFAVIFVLSLTMFGCSSNSPDTSMTQEADSMNSASLSDSQNKENLKMVVGKIKSVAGNQITLEIGEMSEDFSRPEMPSGDFEDFSRPEGGERPDGMEPPANFDSEPPTGDFSFPDFENGEMPTGDFSMLDFENGKVPQGGGRMPQFNAEDLEITYTGETEKYIIPIDVKVGNGDYSSLSKGMIVMLRINENETVSSVSIISQ